MKKLLLLIFLSLIYSFSLSAQITQEQADEIVKERMQSELKFFTLHAKEEVQTGFEIITSIGETLELNYPCWVYYVNYADETNGKYLIVKESNGNLLEVNTKNDEEPDGLEDWRIIDDEYPLEIPFTEYYTQGTEDPVVCWPNLSYPYNGDIVIINSEEELEHYFLCINDYPLIDFSEYTLLVVNGTINYAPLAINITKLSQLSLNMYKLNIEIKLSDAPCTTQWCTAFYTRKLDENIDIELNVTPIQK